MHLPRLCLLEADRAVQGPCRLSATAVGGRPKRPLAQRKPLSPRLSLDSDSKSKTKRDSESDGVGIGNGSSNGDGNAHGANVNSSTSISTNISVSMSIIISMGVGVSASIGIIMSSLVQHFSSHTPKVLLGGRGGMHSVSNGSYYIHRSVFAAILSLITEAYVR